MENDGKNSNPIEGKNEEVKTFTQDQLNAIVGKRLAEQKATNDSDFVKREQELNKRELDFKAKDLLASKGIPSEILEALNYSDEESLNRAISIIEKQINFKKEPIMNAVAPTNGGYHHSAGNAIKQAFGL